MKPYFHIFSVLLIILATTTCRDIYLPDELSSNDSIPVIQGVVSSGQIPTVALSWAGRSCNLPPAFWVDFKDRA